MRYLALILCLLPALAQAGGLVPTRTIPSRSVLVPGDLIVDARATVETGLTIEDSVGMEAQVTLYPGRPVRPGDLGPAAVVERNQIVVLRFRRGSLAIETEGRSLDRAPPGTWIRVMNLSSRTVISGRVTAAGAVEVGR